MAAALLPFHQDLNLFSHFVLLFLFWLFFLLLLLAAVWVFIELRDGGGRGVQGFLFGIERRWR